MTDLLALRQEILRLTREYSCQAHAVFRPADDTKRQIWQEGSPIPYAGRVFTEDEVEAAVASTLIFAHFGQRRSGFPARISCFLGVRDTLGTGSSANLLAICPHFAGVSARGVLIQAMK